MYEVAYYGHKEATQFLYLSLNPKKKAAKLYEAINKNEFNVFNCHFKSLKPEELTDYDFIIIFAVKFLRRITINYCNQKDGSLHADAFVRQLAVAQE